MRCLLRIEIVVPLAVCFVALVALPSYGQGVWRSGSDSADEAAAWRGDALSGGDSFRFAYADTVGYEFPEEEEKPRNVVKDVIVWTTVAAFVAFFIIKVFLEGDTDTPEPPRDGKEVPSFPVDRF